ncbi:MAG: hypothetical protein GY910_08830, partial [bacterium]|nr:hypothetical protein [bacterium]
MAGAQLAEIGSSEVGGTERPLRVGLIGATLETGNLGVSALALSCIGGLIGTGRAMAFS